MADDRQWDVAAFIEKKASVDESLSAASPTRPGPTSPDNAQAPQQPPNQHVYSHVTPQRSGKAPSPIPQSFEQYKMVSPPPPPPPPARKPSPSQPTPSPPQQPPQQEQPPPQLEQPSPQQGQPPQQEQPPQQQELPASLPAQQQPPQPTSSPQEQPQIHLPEDALDYAEKDPGDVEIHSDVEEEWEGTLAGEPTDGTQPSGPSGDHSFDPPEPWFDTQVHRFLNVFACVIPDGGGSSSDDEEKKPRTTTRKRKTAATPSTPPKSSPPPTKEIAVPSPPRDEAPQTQKPEPKTPERPKPKGLEPLEDIPKSDRDHFILVQPWMDPTPTTQATAREDPNEDNDSIYSMDVPKPVTDKETISEKTLALVLLILLVIMAVVFTIAFWDRKDDNTGASMPSMLPTAAPTLTIPSPSPTYGDPELELTIHFDGFPQEIGWTLIDMDVSEVVQQVDVGTYSNANSTQTHRIPVLISRLYSLVVVDEGGNGLCCTQPGSYSVAFRGAVLAFEEGDFGAQVESNFIVPIIVDG